MRREEFKSQMALAAGLHSGSSILLAQNEARAARRMLRERESHRRGNQIKYEQRARGARRVKWPLREQEIE